MKTHRLMLSLLAIAALPLLAMAQSLASSGDSSSDAVGSVSTPLLQPDLTYTRPTQATKLRNYFFDAFGPYPIVGAAFAAGREIIFFMNCSFRIYGTKRRELQMG